MQEFRELLREQMNSKGFSSRGLSRQANALAETMPGWRRLHNEGDGVENWLRPRRSWKKRSVRPRYWKQLAAIAQVLELDEEAAQEFFTSSGWSLDGLRVKADGEQRWILEFGQLPSLEQTTTFEGKELVPVSQEVVSSSDRVTTMVPFRQKSAWTQSRWLVAGLVIVIVAGAGLVVSTTDWSRSSEQAEAGVSFQRSCMIELAEQPYGPRNETADSTEACPELEIRNQYFGYEGEPLEPWDLAVAQCWVAGGSKLWVGFNLSESSQGWLALHNLEGAGAVFKEDRPSNPELRAEPSEEAPVVGNFGYEDLLGKAYALKIYVPKTFDPIQLREFEDSYHLGGCWQQADKDRDDAGRRLGTRGLHFFWPANSTS